MHETYVCKLRVERIYVLLYFSAIRVVNTIPVHIFTYVPGSLLYYRMMSLLYIAALAPGYYCCWYILLLISTRYHASVGINSTGVYLVPRTAVWCVTGTAVRIMNKIVEYN